MVVLAHWLWFDLTKAISSGSGAEVLQTMWSWISSSPCHLNALILGVPKNSVLGCIGMYIAFISTHMYNMYIYIYVCVCVWHQFMVKMGVIFFLGPWSHGPRLYVLTALMTFLGDVFHWIPMAVEYRMNGEAVENQWNMWDVRLTISEINPLQLVKW